jgi:uncharacterized glyoxalase superfamily protein PhnB
MPSTVVPCLRYHDTPAMLAWLCTNFGFTIRRCIPGRQGEVAHAELTLGDGMVMIGTHSEDDYGRLLATPAQAGGLLTQTIWLHVDDADAVHARVLGSGAVITQPIGDAPQGGRAFACRDPEGHLWQVGTYDPWGVA